jgi:hypothetical protein
MNKKILHKIKSSYISSNKYVTCITYSLYVIDIFDRKWRYTKDNSEFELKEEIIKIQNEELKKGYIDPSNYWVYNSEELEGKTFDSLDEIEEIFSSEGFNYDEIKFKSWKLFITTKGGLYYEHYFTFKDYKKLTNLVEKIKKNKIVNLNYWICQGSYEYVNDNLEFNEFKKENEIYKMSYEEYNENRIIDEIEEMIEQDRQPDGSIPGYRD